MKLKARGKSNPLTEAEKERYLELLKNGSRSKDAARAIGRDQGALRKATGQWVPKKKDNYLDMLYKNCYTI